MSGLWDKLKIGRLTARNRVGMAPMGTMFCSEDGTPTDQMLCYYSARAKGGVGIVFIEHTIVTMKYGTAIARLSNFHSDYQIEMYKQLASAIKAHGALAIVQLSIGVGARGAMDEQFRARYGESVSASAQEIHIPGDSTPRGFKALEGAVLPAPRALTTWEVKELDFLWAQAAERVKKAGFDGVEVHAAHGCLLADFMSPLSNKREDEYGGSEQKRLSLVLSQIRAANRLRDDRFVVGIRLSADEHCPGGLSLEDTKRIVPILVEEGLDYVSLSSGRAESYRWFLPPKDGCLVEEAAEIKKICKVPVLCANVHSPQTAEKAVAGGKADMVLVGRGLLADPEWPTKAREGRGKEIVHCAFCNTCLGLFGRDESIRCPQNSGLGRERFVPDYWPMPVKQKGLAG